MDSKEVAKKASNVAKKASVPVIDVWQYVLWAVYAIELLIVDFASIKPLFGDGSIYVFAVLSLIRATFKVVQHIRQSKGDNAD